MRDTNDHSGDSNHVNDRARRQPSWSYLSIALLACGFLAILRLPVASVADVLSPPGRLIGLWPQTLLWVAVAGIWIVGVHQIYRHLKNATHHAEVFEGSSPPPSLDDHMHVTAALWLGVAAVLCAVILPPILVGQWTLQPVQIWQGLYETYGMSAVIASSALAIHLCALAVLTAFALAIVQALAETSPLGSWATRTPVGGILVGIVAASYQGLNGGLPLFITTLTAYTLLGSVHLLAGRRLRWSVPATALTLVFL